ncbi:hypothetical protein D3C81_1333610 [compost metagenome]
MVGGACCAHVGWDIALVVVEGAAQTFAVDQQVVQFARLGPAHVVAHVVLVRLAVEDAQVELLLELAGQWRPVGAYGFQALEDHLVAAVRALHQPGVALLAAFLGAAHGGHQEAPVVRLELQFQRALQAEFVFQVIAPPLVDVLH